jgi:hypothetical protein
MRPVGQLSQPILQIRRQLSDVPAAANRSFVGRSSRIWVAW